MSVFPQSGTIYSVNNTSPPLQKLLEFASCFFCILLFLLTFIPTPHTTGVFPPSQAVAAIPSHLMATSNPLIRESTPTPTPDVPALSQTPLVSQAAIPIPLSFTQPVPMYTYISTYFSLFHPGIDLVAPDGTHVTASEKGIVVHASWADDGYGNMVEIQHPEGYSTIYAHLTEISVQIGQSIEKNQQLGTVGCTGNCSGSHLHFEIHNHTSAVNPLEYFQLK